MKLTAATLLSILVTSATSQVYKEPTLCPLNPGDSSLDPTLPRSQCYDLRACPSIVEPADPCYDVTCDANQYCCKKETSGGKCEDKKVDEPPPCTKCGEGFERCPTDQSLEYQVCDFGTTGRKLRFGAGLVVGCCKSTLTPCPDWTAEECCLRSPFCGFLLDDFPCGCCNGPDFSNPLTGARMLDCNTLGPGP